MPSHLSSVGFDLQTDDEFFALAVQAIERGERFPTHLGSYFKWSPGEGIEIWAQCDRKDNLIGMNPHFSGESVMRVGLTARVERPGETNLDGAFHGWANPGDDDPETGEYPFVFDTPDYGLYEAVQLPALLTVQVAAFAHELRAYDDDEAYDAAQPEEPKFAPESFIPAGLFTSESENANAPSAHAIFAGHVLDTELRTNPATHDKFQWVRIRTCGGVIEAVSDPFAVKGVIKTGGVVQGTFWLTGRLRDFPVRKKPGFLGNLFKRKE
jgi:hypothetical protein